MRVEKAFVLQTIFYILSQIAHTINLTLLYLLKLFVFLFLVQVPGYGQCKTENADQTERGQLKAIAKTAALTRESEIDPTKGCHQC